MVADDAAGRVTFHLVAPDPQLLWKLTMLVAPTPDGTPIGKLESPLPGTGPYQIVPGDSDARLTLARNPSFHEWSRPRPSRPASPTPSPGGSRPTPARLRVAVEHGRADLADVTVPGEAEPQSQTSLVEGLAITAPTRLHPSVLELGTAFTSAELVATPVRQPPLLDAR